MVHFGEFLKTWSLRSNRVSRQVSFNRSKIGGKCQNWKIQMRHFGWFSNTVCKGLPYYGQYFLYFPNFVVKDVELVRQILVKDFYHFFQDRDPTLAIHLGKSEHQADIINRKRLTNARGSEWKNLRTTLSPLFTAGKMKAMIPFMQETCQRLIEVNRSKD